MKYIILFILKLILYLPNLVSTEAYTPGIKGRLNYQNKEIYWTFKSDLSIVYEVKCHKLAECFLFP